MTRIRVGEQRARLSNDRALLCHVDSTRFKAARAAPNAGGGVKLIGKCDGLIPTANPGHSGNTLRPWLGLMRKSRPLFDPARRKATYCANQKSGRATAAKGGGDDCRVGASAPNGLTSPASPRAGN
jgi:hypothetical protein